MDDALLDRRMRDWKQSEMLAREAERAASAAAEPGPVKPLAQRAAQLRRAADVILASILEDIHVRPREGTSPHPTPQDRQPSPRS